MASDSSESKLEPVPDEETTKLSRRNILITVGAIGVGAAAGGFASAQQGQEFQLEGETSGWIGPDGETNPTLSLQAGTDYTVVWENTDGAIHDFAIRDSDGETLLQSDPINEQGATQTVEFTASEDMATYVCTYHPQTMVGDLEVSGGDGTSDSSEEEEEDQDQQEQDQAQDEQDQQDQQEQDQAQDEQDQQDQQEQDQAQDEPSDSEEERDESTDDSEGPTMADEACPDDSKGDKGTGK